MQVFKIYGAMVAEIAAMKGLCQDILGGLIITESAGDPEAKSHCGAFGLTQVMPATAKDKGYDLSTPFGQIFAGADYLAWILKLFADGDIHLALAGYNAGPGRIKNNRWKRYKETVKYVPRVLGNAERYHAAREATNKKGG